MRVEVKPRRGAGVASVTTREEPPPGLWSGSGKEEADRKTRTEQLRLGQLRGRPARLTSGGGIPPGTERSVPSPGPCWALWDGGSQRKDATGKKIKGIALKRPHAFLNSFL